MLGSVNVVIPDDYPIAYGGPDEEDLRRLEPYAAVSVHSSRYTDRAEFFQRIHPADVVINVRAYSVFDDEAFGHAQNLRLVSILGTGTDNIDLDAATHRGIVVTNTPAVSAVSVAELALGLMLAVARAIPLSERRLRAGIWQHQVGSELQGKTLGLLGLGAIGQHFARLGKGLGMRVIGWSFRPDAARAASCGVELVDRDEVFRQADVLSVHLRNTPEARGLVSHREFGLMKPSAILINTARAAIVDQDALVDALREHRIAGAGLDVYMTEPLPLDQNPFSDMDNVVIMPHAGGVTAECNVRSLKMPVDNIIAFLNGHPEHVVNPAVLVAAAER